MRSLVRPAIVLGALMTIACSLVVDTSGLSGGAPDDSDGHDGAVSHDAAAKTGDAGGKADAQASADGTTPATTGCAGSTDFLCADFDHGAVADGWTEPRVTGGGTIALADTFSSAPHSFHATTPGGGNGETQARLIADVPSLSPKGVVVSMQMMLSDVKGAIFEIVKIEEATNGGGIKLFHTGDVSHVQIQLRSRPPFERNLPVLPVGRWFSIVIDTRYDRTAGSIQIKVDDVVVLDEQSLPTFQDPITAFFVGPWTDEPTNPCDAQFDDVRVRFDQ